MIEFKDWLMEKLIEWGKTQDRRHQSDSAFARYLKVPQSSLSQWLAGSYLPEEENIKKIEEKYGDEVYDALGRPRPDHLFEKLEKLYDETPDENHEELINRVEDIAKGLGLGTKRMK
jgi:transcriptional regulator with XRE-family HTH domain